MTNTIEQALAYARAHPKRDGGSWAGWCESFVWRAGGFDRSFPTALAAGSASGTLNTRWQDAPSGAIHYWAGVGGDGHVAFGLGNGMLLMASSRVSNMGTALGTIHFSNYNLPLYRGWTMRHGTQTLAGSSSAATISATPLPPVTITTPKDTDMKMIKVPNGTIALIGEYTGAVYTSAEGGQGFSIGSNTKAYGEVTNLSGDEVTTLVNEALGRRNALINDIVARIAAPKVDTAAITAAIIAAVKPVTGAVDIAALAAAVDAVLADNFAGIPAAVRADIKSNL